MFFVDIEVLTNCIDILSIYGIDVRYLFSSRSVRTQRAPYTTGLSQLCLKTLQNLLRLASVRCLSILRRWLQYASLRSHRTYEADLHEFRQERDRQQLTSIFGSPMLQP